MKKAHYIFFAGLVFAFLYVQNDLNKKLDNIKQAKLKNSSTNPVAVVNASKPAVNTVEVAAEPPEAFVRKFQKEAQQIGRIQNNPEQAQLRLKALAQVMDPNQVQALYELISNDKSNADERALGVELLSIKNDASSLIALQNFVANSKNVNGVKWDHKKELETVLRAQAIESIAAFPEKEIALSTLNFLQQKVDQKFLNDRINRANLSLITGQKTLQEQDEEALKKLVE